MTNPSDGRAINTDAPLFTSSGGPICVFTRSENRINGMCNERHRPQLWDAATGRHLGDDRLEAPADSALDLTNKSPPLPPAIDTDALRRLCEAVPLQEPQGRFGTGHGNGTPEQWLAVWNLADAARNALPALLDEVERLRAENAELRKC